MGDFKCPKVLDPRCYPDGRVPSCEKLVSDARAGIAAAADELARRVIEEFVPRVVRPMFAARPDLLDDAIGEACLDVWRYLHTWDGSAPFCVWVHVVARHAAYRVRRGFPGGPGLGLDDGGPAAPATQRGMEPECMQCIEQTLASMKPNKSKAWRRYYLDDPHPTQAEIGMELGVTRETVNNWLNHVNARIRLRCSGACQ